MRPLERLRPPPLQPPPPPLARTYPLLAQLYAVPSPVDRSDFVTFLVRLMGHNSHSLREYLNSRPESGFVNAEEERAVQAFLRGILHGQPAAVGGAT